MSANISVILVLYWRHNAEMVVAEAYTILCRRSSASGEMAYDELASGELASDDVIFKSAFFRRTMLLTFQERFQSDALQASI